MIVAVALLSALVLLALAALHLLWALGIWWPVPDEKALVRAIAGFKGIDTMPSRHASLAVASALAVSAAVAYLLGCAEGVPLPIAVAGGGCAAVFAARGAAGYTPAWARLTPEEPFRTNDRRYYSPLCLALGGAFLLLFWSYLA